jgi:hypothetical protein
MNLVAGYCWMAVWMPGLANRDAMNAAQVRAKEMLVCVIGLPAITTWPLIQFTIQA